MSLLLFWLPYKVQKQLARKSVISDRRILQVFVNITAYYFVRELWCLSSLTPNRNNRESCKVKKSTALNRTPSLSYIVSFVIWDHTVLLATQHMWTHAALIPAGQAGQYLIYLLQRDGRLSWPRWLDTYGTEMVYQPTHSHPSKYWPSSRPGFKLATCWLQFQHSEHY